MRKILKTLKFIVVIMLMLFAFSIVTYASEDTPRVVDKENLFTDAQEKALEQKITEIREKYKCDLVILTTSYFDYSAQMYAESYYDTNSYGYGSSCTGVLLLVSKTQREYWITTTGNAIEIFDNNALEALDNDVYEKLSNDEFYKSAEAFISTSEKILSADAKGMNYVSSDNIVTAIVVILIISIIVGIVGILIMRNQMNNAKPQRGATHYVKQGSFNLTLSRDMYLYSTIRRVPRAQNNSRSGSSRGGFGGGGSHGGRGGRF